MANYSAFMMWTNTLVPEQEYHLGRLRRHWPRPQITMPAPGVAAPPTTPLEATAPLADLIALNNELLAALPASPITPSIFDPRSSIQQTISHLSLGSIYRAEASSPSVARQAQPSDPFYSSEGGSSTGDAPDEWEDVSSFNLSPGEEGTPAPIDPYDQPIDIVAGLAEVDRLRALQFTRPFQGHQEEHITEEHPGQEQQIRGQQPDQEHIDEARGSVGRLSRLTRAMRRASDKLHDVLTNRNRHGDKAPGRARAESLGDPFRPLRGVAKPESERKIRRRLIQTRQMDGRELELHVQAEAAAGRRLADKFGQRRDWFW